MGNLTIGLKSILPSLLVKTSSAPFKDTRRDELVDVYEGGDVPLLSREENSANYARGEFVFNVKYGARIVQSSQNIDYVRKIAESLESSDASKWKCDLEGIPAEYVIIDEVKIGDEEYVICGYPDPKKMRQHIDLLRPQPVAKSLQEIHAEQRTASSELYREWYNKVYSTEQDKQVKDDNEIYKMIPTSLNRKYLEAWYNENPNNPIESERIPADQYDVELAKLYSALPTYDKYINDLMLEYLNKPNMRLRYVFLVFKKHTIKSIRAIIKLEPAFFNLKDLEPRHQPVLQKILDLIQVEIPARWGILDNSRNNLTSYKLFHSYMKYGDFFHITTEYLHTMSNITRYAYIYENSITLEEMIYACGRTATASGAPFLKELKLEYKLKLNRLNLSINNSNTIRKSFRKSFRNTRKSFPTRNTSSKMQSGLPNFDITGSKIVVMYEKNYAEYVIVLIDSTGQCLQLIIKSHMNQHIPEICIQLEGKHHLVYQCGNSSFRLIKAPLKIFKITSLDIFTKEMLAQIFRANPLVYYRIKQYPLDLTISFSYYFENELLPMESTPKIINMYLKTPILLINYMNNPSYLKHIKNNLYDLSNFKSTEVKEMTTKFVNYTNNKNKQLIEVYKNPNNCGYNIIITNKDNIKFTYWVIPIGTSKYLRDFKDLDASHLNMLNQLKKLIHTKSTKLYLHNTPSLSFLCIHVHIHEQEDYTRTFPAEEKGSYFFRESNISNIMANLYVDNNYYANYNVSTLKTY